MVTSHWADFTSLQRITVKFHCYIESVLCGAAGLHMSKDELEDLRKRIVEAAASARFDQAISDCRSAVEACNDDEDTSRLLANMSLLYHQKGDWNKATEMAERALQAWPGNVKACFRKGAAQMRLALPAAACVSFQRGLQLAPGHRHLQTALHQAQSQLREDFTPGIIRASGPRNCELASQDAPSEALDHLERRTQVIKQLWQAGQVHQASLRGKGWYESCKQDEARQAQLHPLCGDLDASNLHQILQIAQGSSFREMRAAYKRLLLAAHPDKGGSVESFERLHHAYCTLISQHVGTC